MGVSPPEFNHQVFLATVPCGHGATRADMINEDAEVVEYVGVCPVCGREYFLTYDKVKHLELDGADQQ